MNIVFDTIIESIFEDPDTQNLVRQEVFEHPDWVELDRGTIALEHAIDRGAARTGLPRQVIGRLLEAVPRFLTPIETTIDLIRKMSRTNHGLFVLSNMHLASIAYLEKNHGIWDLFDGIVISSRIQMVKPEPQIYEYLLEQYRLEPVETIFIDDLPENLEAASSLGIQTVRFVDAAQCERALARVL